MKKIESLRVIDIGVKDIILNINHGKHDEVVLEIDIEYIAKFYCDPNRSKMTYNP